MYNKNNKIMILKSKWGKWTDLCTGAVHEKRYLLQARRHKNGQIQFRVESSGAAWGCEKPSISDLEKVKFKKKSNKICNESKKLKDLLDSKVVSTPSEIKKIEL